jgi:hypothetical protein
VLVIVAIIAALVSTLPPTIKRVREASDRSSSANKLKQITLATIHYADQNNMNLPPIEGGRGVPGRASVHFAILPHLEANGLVARQGEDEARPIKVFLSSNDPTADGWSPGTANTTSYLCNLHVYGPRNDDPASAEANPLSAASGSRYPDDLADGTAHVLSFAEAYSRPGLDSTRRNYLSGAGTTFTAADLPSLAAPNFGAPGPVCYFGNGLQFSMMDGGVRLVTPRVVASQWPAACLPRDKANPIWE